MIRWHKLEWVRLDIEAYKAYLGMAWPGGLEQLQEPEREVWYVWGQYENTNDTVILSESVVGGRQLQCVPKDCLTVIEEVERGTIVRFRYGMFCKWVNEYNFGVQPNWNPSRMIVNKVLPLGYLIRAQDSVGNDYLFECTPDYVEPCL